MIEGIPLAIDFRKGSMRVLRAAEDSTQPFQLPTLFDHDEVLGILRGQLGGVSRIVQVVWHMPPDHLTPQEQCWTDLDTDRLSADLGIPVNRVTDTRAVVKYVTTNGLNASGHPFGLLLANDSDNGHGGGVRTYLVDTDGTLTVIVPEGHAESDFIKWEMESLTQSPARLLARADVLRRRQITQGRRLHDVFVWSEDTLRLPRRPSDCVLAPLTDDASCLVQFLPDPLAHLVGAMRSNS